MIELTVLCENSVYSHLGAIAEHGWSVYVQTPEGDFLFDTGLGLALRNNLAYFNKDLSKISGIIISHHHTDHTGGLKDALLLSGGTKVYSHPDLFKESYSIGREQRYIGIPYSKAYLEGLGAEWVFNREFTEIAPSIYLTGEVPRKTSYELGDERQVIDTKEGFKPDPLLDDQSLVFKTEKGLVILLGCGHAGIINILNHAIEKTGEERIHAILGGTHLGPVSQEQREKSIEALQSFSIDNLGVSHCTGAETVEKLGKIYQEKFFQSSVGTRFTV